MTGKNSSLATAHRSSLVARFAAAASVVGAAVLGGGVAAQTPSISGVWRIEKPISAVRTSNGQAPPLRADAAKIYQQHIALHRQNDHSYDSASWCASVGMPRVMLIDYPFEIVDESPYIAFLDQWNWWAHIVYLDGALGAAANSATAPSSGIGLFLGGSDPNGPMGLSTGKWQRDTLVVDTDHLVDSTVIDNSGVPHSDALKLTEWIRLRSPDVLEDRIRFDDPKIFTRPWETVITYRRLHQDILEDVCLDRLKAGQPAIEN